MLAGCTVVVKCPPAAPGEAYVVAEVAEQVGLPPGVFNVVAADRDVSELLVTDPRVDKISFTGSTAAGRRIASLCGERIARCTLELGGKSAAVVLDDADLATAAETLAREECNIAGQVCSSLTRIIVTRARHDDDGRRARRRFSRGSQSATRSTPRRRWDRSPCDVSATASRATSPRGSPRAPPRDRWRSAGAPRPRLVRRADRVRQRRQLVDDRPGGDLRSGAERDPGRRRAARGRARQRHDLRAQLVGLHQRPRPRRRASPASCGAGRWATTRGATTSAWRSAASSSRASAARAAARDSSQFLETKSVILDDVPSTTNGSNP